MTVVTVSLKTLAAVAVAGDALATALDALGEQAQAVDQLKLPLEGADQACEDFMAEREELKAKVAKQAVDIEALQREVANLRNERTSANAAFQHIAAFGNALQESLNRVGVGYSANPETGLPEIVCQPETLLASLTGSVDAARLAA